MNIKVNGANIYYEATGEGFPLILLHGNGEDSTIFDKLAPRLAENFKVYTIDSRNHGQSEKTDDYSYETMAEDLYEFIQAMDMKKPGIVGFSDGAISALLLAMKHSEAAGRLALLGINLKPEDFTEESYQYLKEEYEKTRDPLVKLMLTEPDIQLEDVKNVKAPVLLFEGENDIFKPESFEMLEKALPNARLIVMSGHDHGSYIVNNDITCHDLTAFFS